MQEVADGVAWLFGRRWFRLAFAALTLALIAFVLAVALVEDSPPAIDPADAEDRVMNSEFNGRVVVSADCPGGHHSVSGEMFICDVVFDDGSTGQVNVEVLNNPGFWSVDLER